jgi:hypothetical protein
MLHIVHMSLISKLKGISLAWLVPTGVLVFVIYQALSMSTGPSRTPIYPNKGEKCKGEPIVVNYPYDGGLLKPHECKIQCDTDQDHYILYTNNVATQCEPAPGCSDWGEDNDVMCELESSE